VVCGMDSSVSSHVNRIAFSKTIAHLKRREDGVKHLAKSMFVYNICLKFLM